MRVLSLSILLILVLGASAIRRQSTLQSDIAAKIKALYEDGEPLPEILPTTALVGSEEIPAFVPLPKVYDVEAPLADIKLDNGDDVVVQLFESYESHGESYVVLNAGGQNLTVQAEVLPTSVPLSPVFYEGKVYVAEVVSSQEGLDGKNYVIAVTGEGEYESFEAKVLAQGVAVN